MRVAFRVMGGIGLYPCMVAMLGLGHEKQHGRQSPHLPPSLPLALSAKSCLSTPTPPHPPGLPPPPLPPPPNPPSPPPPAPTRSGA